MTPKPYAFVIMPFDASFRDTYMLGIKPACVDAGYFCDRLDEQIFEETMLERIYNQIAKADLVVADLSDRNPNVFYETGYAHALGKRVILLTKNANDIPFDLRHHFHIVYSDGIAFLKQKLAERASFYLKHPESPISDPFKKICILINKKKIDISNDVIKLKAYAFQTVKGETYTRINLAFHIADNSIESEFEIQPQLFTSAKFYRTCDFRKNPVPVYKSIDMPDGRVLHKPLAPIKIAPHSPDSIVFDAIFGGGLEDPVLMSIQLSCGGFMHDINLYLHVSWA